MDNSRSIHVLAFSPDLRTCATRTSAHLTRASLRVLRKFAWLKASSLKIALSRHPPAGNTPLARTYRNNRT